MQENISTDNHEAEDTLWYTDQAAEAEGNDDWDESDTPDTPTSEMEESLYKLKHLGREYNIPLPEVIALAQKGMDYDRIRARADSLMLESAGSTGAPPNQEGTRRDSEILEFISVYRDVTPEDIPPEIWEEVNQGRSLLSAYQGYENRQLKALIEAGTRDQENRRRSTGSRATAGNSRERGEVESDWYGGQL
ncbi:MAG: hypothetical protein FWC90_04845 [Oscillospiraceae bacterium]|nr:hypothetical protein [Oscillospiraceae bacterium]